MKDTLIFLLLLILLFFLEIFYFHLAEKYGIVDRPNGRSSHTQVTLRGGGIIFYFGALAAFFLSGATFPWFMAGLTVVAGVSFVDDIRSLRPATRLLLQFLASLMMLWQVLVSNGIPDGTRLGAICVFMTIALIVCTGITNVYNFMDGINGITGGYSLIVLLALAWAYHAAGMPREYMLLIAAAITADLVFCYFNFRKKARCFAGDVGSVSAAFIIVFLIGVLVVRTRNLSWLTLLAVYGVDGVLTIIHRIMLHENLSEPHRKHAYQIMANELHFPHLAVSAFYMALQAAVCMIYMVWPGYLTLLISVFMLSIIYIWFMGKYFHLHMEGKKE